MQRISLRSILVLLFICFEITAPNALPNHEPVDTIYTNGVLWTGDPSKPTAEALAVKGEYIAAVGSNTEILKSKGSSTQVVDLKGRFVTPGFNDAHLHFLVRPEVELNESDDLKTIQKKLRDFVAAHPDSTWILGRGWGYTSFPDRKPHRRYLDEIVKDRPVRLSERDGHMLVLNSKALELSHITRKTPDPDKGRIIRDEKGEPTGELQESAMDLVNHLIPDPDPAEMYSALKDLLDRAASYGLTSAQNASFEEADLPVFERVLKENGLKVRFRWAVDFKNNATASDFAHFRSLSARFPEKVMKFGAAKGFLDGVVDAQTAAMFEPYTTGKNGIALWKQEDLNEAAALYDREGFQILLHAIGDKAIAMALDAYEHVIAVNGPRDRRDRIEHIEVPRLSDYARFKKLGVIASTQALFANPDKTTLDNYAVLLGPARASHANAFKLFDDAGAVQAFGSDWPVFSMEVLRGIYCAAARKTAEGTPLNGWYPENRITVEAALHHFTVDAAYAGFDEKVKGTLSPGKLADFVVLSDNILQPPVERVLQTKVVMTVMGGKITYGSL